MRRAAARRGADSPLLRAVAAAFLGSAAPLAAQQGDPGGVENVLVQDVHVSSYPGYEMDGTLTLPAQQGPAPTVLVLTDARSRNGTALVERLVRELGVRGVATLRLELPVREVEESEAVAGDAFAAIQYLRGREDVDGDRIVVLAYGGAADAALEAAAVDQAVRAVVLLAPAPGAASRSARANGTPVLVQSAANGPVRRGDRPPEATATRFIMNALD